MNFFSGWPRKSAIGGGDATLVRAREIEGLPNEKLIELFNTARSERYATLLESLRQALIIAAKREVRTGSWRQPGTAIRKQFREHSANRLLQLSAGPGGGNAFAKRKGRNQAKRQFQRLRREITAAEPGLLGRDRKSTASGPPG